MLVCTKALVADHRSDRIITRLTLNRMPGVETGNDARLNERRREQRRLQRIEIDTKHMPVFPRGSYFNNERRRLKSSQIAAGVLCMRKPV